MASTPQSRDARVAERASYEPTHTVNVRSGLAGIGRIGWTEKSPEAVHRTDLNSRNGLFMTQRAQRLFGA